MRPDKNFKKIRLVSNSFQYSFYLRWTKPNNFPYSAKPLVQVCDPRGQYTKLEYF